jgi:hypothetical protein
MTTETPVTRLASGLPEVAMFAVAVAGSVPLISVPTAAPGGARQLDPVRLALAGGGDAGEVHLADRIAGNPRGVRRGVGGLDAGAARGDDAAAGAEAVGREAQRGGEAVGAAKTTTAATAATTIFVMRVAFRILRIEVLLWSFSYRPDCVSGDQRIAQRLMKPRVGAV